MGCSLLIENKELVILIIQFGFVYEFLLENTIAIYKTVEKMLSVHCVFKLYNNY